LDNSRLVASLPLSAASTKVKLYWISVSAGGDQGRCALVFALRALPTAMSKSC
jgi:hypothetical protein